MELESLLATLRVEERWRMAEEAQRLLDREHGIAGATRRRWFGMARPRRGTRKGDRA